ncbi:MAG TPA: hypothetical protein VHW03_04940 [Chthoniobacterales bacterium]|jgi:hypothetical protein|nr:hypothetical protein [Chthoniobacterales bacterium]
MKLAQWVRFSWDLEKLSPSAITLPEHYRIGLAPATDAKELRAVIARSFANDNSWGDAIHEVNAMIDGWLERVFQEENGALCLALRHGLRIIGASILIPDAAEENNLAPGPCVLMEYRNRGLGSALLGESLCQLGAAGLTRVAARARENTLVAKFLYPKFEGTRTENNTPLLAA